MGTGCGLDRIKERFVADRIRSSLRQCGRRSANRSRRPVHAEIPSRRCAAFSLPYRLVFIRPSLFCLNSERKRNVRQQAAHKAPLAPDPKPVAFFRFTPLFLLFNQHDHRIVFFVQLRGDFFQFAFFQPAFVINFDQPGCI